MEGSHFPPGTVLEKSRRGRVYPAGFRTRQGEKRASINQLCPFHAVNKWVPCCVAL